jgi:hypothetical protein
MLNYPFPFDNSQLDQERRQAMEDANAYWTLHDFRVLVDTMGIEEVIKRMDEDTFWKLHTYFKDRA